MLRLQLAIALIAAVAAPAIAAGQGSMHSPAIDASADKVKFQTAQISGSVTYHRVYQKGWERAVLVSLNFAQPKPLACFTYADFQYDLRDHQGRRIPVTADLTRGGEVFPLHAVSPHDCVRGKAYPRQIGRAYFDLNTLFGKLPSDGYTLTLTFAPRDATISPVVLPTISFRLVDSP